MNKKEKRGRKKKTEKLEDGKRIVREHRLIKKSFCGGAYRIISKSCHFM